MQGTTTRVFSILLSYQSRYERMTNTLESWPGMQEIKLLHNDCIFKNAPQRVAINSH